MRFNVPYGAPAPREGLKPYSAEEGVHLARGVHQSAPDKGVRLRAIDHLFDKSEAGTIYTTKSDRDCTSTPNNKK